MDESALEGLEGNIEGPGARSFRHHVDDQPTVEERLAAGKHLRERVPRNAHAQYQPALDRPDPVAVLEEQNRTRLPDLVPVRYARMLVSPFAFLRGAASMMAFDLSGTPTTGLKVQACGDMHIANFGVFGSAERNLVFGINDFDETLPGPWEWDLKRLAASVVVCARYLGLDTTAAEAIAKGTVATYRTAIRDYALLGHLETWYAQIDETAILAGVHPSERPGIERFMRKARQRTNVQVLAKMTDLVDDQRRIVEQPPLIVRETQSETGRPIAEGLALFLESYVPSLPEERRVLFGRYTIVDVARKVVGVGSVGTRCWVLFLEGNGQDDPLFLQVKEAQASVLAPHAGRSRYANEGRRVVVGQRLIQGAPDIFLGWGKQDAIHFYVRQLRDMKGSLQFEPAKVEPGAPGFGEYCRLCSHALALAHAKSGDAATIAGYVGRSEALDVAVAQFAAAYADQTERDYESLVQAARHGRIRAAADV